MNQAQNFGSTSFEEFVKPAKEYTTFKLNEAVKLRIGNAGLTAAKPITLAKFFRENCEKYAQRPALSYEQRSENGQETNWITLNYADYNAKVEQVALMLLQLGLAPKTGVGILAHNCPEWFIANFAGIRAGGVTFGIYQTSSPDAVHHALQTADATICIVDDAEQMEKVRTVHAHLPKLRAVVQLNGPFAAYVGLEKGFHKWQDLLENCKVDEKMRNELHRRESEIYANQCASLIFTSGTTGFPKAVMMSHDNIIFSVKTMYSTVYNDLDSDIFNIVSYLPLSHVGGQCAEIYGPLYLGAHVYFADRNALKGTLLRTLQDVRPKMLFSVPSVYEKFQLHLTCKGITKNSGVDVKKLMGLDRCKYFFIGAAPATIELKSFFLKFNMQLVEVYGLSEISGGPIHNYNSQKTESVGKPMEGIEIKISHNGASEITLRGRNVFMGYLQEPTQTAQAIDSDGWLRTGDIGYIDEEGDLVVTGRLKELLITTGGENIPFLLIESTIKQELPMISNAIVVGDKRKYLTVLLTLKTESNHRSASPADKLSAVTTKWLQTLNLDYETVADVFQVESELNPKIEAALDAGLQRVNSKALSRAQRVQKFRLLPHDFSIETLELGPTLKTRRNFILQKYATLIDSMYN